MSWSSTYQAQFSEQLVDQLLAIVQRDQRAALDWVGGGLADFQTYMTSPILQPQYPCLLIAPVEDLFDPESQAGSLHYSSTIEVEIGVAHQDVRIVGRTLQRYIRAVDAIVHTLADKPGAMADLYTGLALTLPELAAGTMTTPLQTGSVKEIWIGSHRLSEIAALKQGGFWKAAKIEIRVDREEL